MIFIFFHGFSAINVKLVDCRCRDHPGSRNFISGSDVEIDSEISQILILNILRFEFSNNLTLCSNERYNEL